MTARMRRIASDWAQIQKDFAGHKNIKVTPVGELPPEKYNVTYYVNGVYLLPDGRIETLGRHEVEIILHAEYPRYKPICKIMTPIWHPNFRDGQICIGDIWGAGESLSDIIINIGDMIQYKSWNSYSPLSAEAAQWAMKNKHLFPVGTINLHIADYASSKETVNIDMLEEQKSGSSDEPGNSPTDETQSTAAIEESNKNDFEITAEELADVVFIPTAQRMQSVSHGGMVKGNKVNFKTVLVKGLIWALIGAVLGLAVTELTDKNLLKDSNIARITGHPEMVEYYDYNDAEEAAWEDIYARFNTYCEENDLDPDGDDSFSVWAYDCSPADEKAIDNYLEISDLADDAFYDAYIELGSDKDVLKETLGVVTRTSTAIWSAIIALFIGLSLGIGEGVFYGSKEQALKYALIGAGISVVVGYLSGNFAQMMYAEMITDSASSLTSAFIRGLGWALMGLGVGLAIGLIKPEKKRILFCCIGGVGGAFIGGFLFNYVFDIIPNNVVARCVAILIMGGLIGVCVGLLEQFAKQAWLKVIRGEFEGKEYLVFAGTTSIGNNGKNTIVLFKDKLVAPHHCDIVLEGSQYVVVDRGSPIGTVVNGMKTTRHVLRQGDAIAVGNSVLVFNTK